MVILIYRVCFLYYMQLHIKLVLKRTATLEVRFCPVSINPPSRLKNCVRFNVYAVYAKEIDTPDGCEPVEWMLLISESVLS